MTGVDGDAPHKRATSQSVGRAFRGSERASAWAEPAAGGTREGQAGRAVWPPQPQPSPGQSSKPLAPSLPNSPLSSVFYSPDTSFPCSDFYTTTFSLRFSLPCTSPHSAPDQPPRSPTLSRLPHRTRAYSALPPTLPQNHSSKWPSPTQPPPFLARRRRFNGTTLRLEVL